MKKCYYLRDIPEEHWRKFLALSALRGKSPREVLLQMIKQEIKDLKID